MERNEKRTLPRFRSLDDLVEFFEHNDLGEYWSALPEARFSVRLKRRAHLISIDRRLADKVAAIARARHTSSEGLINAWIREKLRQSA